MSFYTANRKYRRLLAENACEEVLYNQHTYMNQVLKEEEFYLLLSDLEDFIIDISKLSIPDYCKEANKGLTSVIYEIRNRYYDLLVPFDRENEQSTEI